jgi:hypothetical protein
MGECLSELPGCGLPAITTVEGKNLELRNHSLSVENGDGKQVDTIYKYSPHEKEGPSENLNKLNSLNTNLGSKEGIQVLG